MTSSENELTPMRARLSGRKVDMARPRAGRAVVCLISFESIFCGGGGSRLWPRGGSAQIFTRESFSCSATNLQFRFFNEFCLLVKPVFGRRVSRRFWGRLCVAAAGRSSTRPSSDTAMHQRIVLPATAAPGEDPTRRAPLLLFRKVGYEECSPQTDQARAGRDLE